MTFKIPDAPNIVGGSAVTREPDSLRPMAEIKTEKINVGENVKQFNALVGTLEDMAQDQTDSFMLKGRTEFVDHFSQRWVKIKSEHKGEDAASLYDRFLKKEMDDWVADATGEPKDDGKLRMTSPVLKQQYEQWVDTQRVSYMNEAASYQYQQWEEFKKTEHDANVASAAQTIATAGDNPLKLESGIQQMKDAERIYLRGMDDRYIMGSVATRVDAAMLSYITNIATNDPVQAMEKLYDERVGGWMKQDSIVEAKKVIREDFKNKAINEKTDFMLNNNSGSAGLSNEVLVARMLGTTDEGEIKNFIADVNTKAEERHKGILAGMQGEKERQVNSSTSMIMSGLTDISGNGMNSIQAGLAGLATQDQELAINLQDKIQRTFAERYAYAEMEKRGMDVMDVENAVDTVAQDIQGLDNSERVDKIIKRIDATSDINEVNQILKDNGVGWWSRISARAAVTNYKEGVNTQETTDAALRKVLSKSVKEKPSAALRQDVARRTVDNMVADGKISPEAADGLTYMLVDSWTDRDVSDEYNDALNKASTGSIASMADVEGVEDMSPNQVFHLMNTIQITQDFNTVKNKIERQTGTTVDKILTNTGVFEQLKNTDQGSANAFKSKFVTRYAQATRDGSVPSVDTMNQWAIEIARDSKDETRAAMERAEDEVTKAINYGVANGQTVIKSKEDTTERQYEVAGRVIDKMASYDGLTGKQRMRIKTNREYLINLYIAGGDFRTQMLNFIQTAERGH